MSYPYHTALAVRADAERLQVAGQLMHQITGQMVDLTAWQDSAPRWSDAAGEVAISSPWLRDEDVAALPTLLAAAAPDADPETLVSTPTSGRAYDASGVLLAAYEVTDDPRAALAALGLSPPEPPEGLL